MSFNPPGPGYGPPAQPSGGLGSKGLPHLLTLGVLVLGIVTFLIGFAPFAKVSTFADTTLSQTSFEGGYPVVGLAMLLLGGLLAGLSLLPEHSYEALAAATSLVGFAVSLCFLFSLSEGVSLAWGGIVILILGFVQLVLAVTVVLFALGLLKAPAPRPVGYAPQGYGQPQGYGEQQFPGGYGQQQAYGQQQPGYPQPGYPQQQYPGGYAPQGYGQPQAPQGYGQPQAPAPQAYGAGYGQQVNPYAPTQAYPAAGGQQQPAGQPQPGGQPLHAAPATPAEQPAPAEQSGADKPAETPDTDRPAGAAPAAPTQAFGAATKPTDD